MTTVKAKAGYMAAGALLTVFALYPMLKETKRDQQWGMLLTPEEVKASCGRPQSDDIYTLTYLEGDKRVLLQFMGANHRIYLNSLKWSSNNGSGSIPLVSTSAMKSFKDIGGWYPSCLDQLVK